MGLTSEGVGWRLLESMSSSQSPAIFIDFYNAIRAAASRLGLKVLEGQHLISEVTIENQMGRAMESLNHRPPGLPAVGHLLTIEGESWHVLLNMTAIPHLSTAFVERAAKSALEKAYRYELIANLTDSNQFSFGRVGDDEFRGKTWELYLYCKIQKIKRLRHLFAIEPFRREPALLSPSRVFPGLAGTLPAMSTVNEDQASIRNFLDQCDENLIQHSRKEELSRYLKNASISANEFLRAQKPTFF